MLTHTENKNFTPYVNKVLKKYYPLPLNEIIKTFDHKRNKEIRMELNITSITVIK